MKSPYNAKITILQGLSKTALVKLVKHMHLLVPYNFIGATS